MSSVDDLEKEAVNMNCASCGKAAIDDIELKDCDGGCDLARYCSDKCKKDNRPEHEAICKERAATLREEVLFRQNEKTHIGDCPICFLPMPTEVTKTEIQSCCGELICKSCVFIHMYEAQVARRKYKCPFCRKVRPTSRKEANDNVEKRAASNDPRALGECGARKSKQGDYASAFHYLTKAAALNHAESHFNLSIMYMNGEGVEQDDKLMVYHLEEAAIGGDPDARNNLGNWEWRCKRYDRAVKHFIIAANLGHEKSIKDLTACYKRGYVSKDDFATALRAYQAAVDEMKSPDREFWEETIRNKNSNDTAV